LIRVPLRLLLDSREIGSKATSRNLESLKHSVIKRAFSYAKTSKKCGVCGAQCKKLMIFESRIVYSMGVSKDSGEYEETVEDLLNNTMSLSRRFGNKVGAGVQKYLTPIEARYVNYTQLDFENPVF